MLKKIVIGGTGIAVSQMGLGTVKFGRNQQVHYPKEFELPDDTHCIELLTVAKELGINLLDTAPAYGNSEERLGKLLKNQRHDWIISTKVGESFINSQSHFDFSPQAIHRSIEHSLKQLQTDYLDIVLVHSNGDDEKIIRDDSVFETLSCLKDVGKIRAFGMSTKTVVGGKLTLEYADIAMVSYNPTYTDEKPVLHDAYQKNKGIFIKKALASGHLQKIASNDPVKTAMEFIFREPGVTSVIVGTLNTEHLRYNAHCINSI
jgi:aryl-alcohol dehydrogenase-like predicted oxidoreductase